MKMLSDVLHETSSFSWPTFKFFSVVYAEGEVCMAIEWGGGVLCWQKAMAETVQYTK